MIAITIPNVVTGYLSITTLQKVAQPLSTVPGNISEISTKTELNASANDIQFYDEVLTQSARNYAFTQDTQWKDRYNAEVTNLDSAISSALTIGGEADETYFTETKSANDALVAMELSAIELVDNGQPDQAVQILESDEYWKQKAIYSQGISGYVEHTSTLQGATIQNITENIDDAVEETDSVVKKYIPITIAVVATSVLLGVSLGLIAAYLIIKPIANIQKAAKEISRGNLKIRAVVKSADELGSLARSFNTMAEKIQELKQNLEKKIHTRTSELEKLNSYFVGREVKMVELKKRIAELETSKSGTIAKR